MNLLDRVCEEHKNLLKQYIRDHDLKHILDQYEQCRINNIEIQRNKDIRLSNIGDAISITVQDRLILEFSDVKEYADCLTELLEESGIHIPLIKFV